MGRALDTGLTKLRGTIDGSATVPAAASVRLSGVAGRIATSAEETSAQAQTVAAAAEQISRSVDTVSAGGEQMGASIPEITQNAAQVESRRAVADLARVPAGPTSLVATVRFQRGRPYRSLFV